MIQRQYNKKTILREDDMMWGLNDKKNYNDGTNNDERTT